MEYREELLWILDKPEEEPDRMRNTLSRQEFLKWHTDWENEKYRQNIDFVHSLGLKCDCVGWCRLDLSGPNTGAILDRIEAFCREDGWLARGIYSRCWAQGESEWYSLDLPEAKGIWGYQTIVGENGGEVRIKELHAYKDQGKHALYGYQGYYFVSERFREVCLRHRMPHVRFCWARDTGRYDAGQFFSIYPDRCVKKIACDRYLCYSDQYSDWSEMQPHGIGTELNRRLEALGGWLPRLGQVFSHLECRLPQQIPTSELPAEGFAQVYAQRFNFVRHLLLVHRNTAEILLAEKVVSKKQLQPVCLYEEGAVPAGYVEEAMDLMPRPHLDFFAQMEAEYEAILLKPRPVRKTTPKEAVKLLRRAKTARKADFSKRMKKALAAELEGTDYEPLAAYYLVADGGMLSDEYEFLSCDRSRTATAEFMAEQAREELLEQPQTGIVIAQCADGDHVLLRPDGTTVRISHEIPELLEEWPTLAQFFADCVELEEE